MKADEIGLIIPEMKAGINKVNKEAYTDIHNIQLLLTW